MGIKTSPGCHWLLASQCLNLVTKLHLVTQKSRQLGCLFLHLVTKLNLVTHLSRQLGCLVEWGTVHALGDSLGTVPGTLCWLPRYQGALSKMGTVPRRGTSRVDCPPLAGTHVILSRAKLLDLATKLTLATPTLLRSPRPRIREKERR